MTMNECVILIKKIVGQLADSFYVQITQVEICNCIIETVTRKSQSTSTFIRKLIPKGY